MILLISIVHIIVCLILIAIILFQPGRGMGLSNASLGSDSQSVFGTKTADVLTKATTVAAVLFMVTCIALSALTARKSRSLYSNFKDQSPITMEQIQKAVQEAEKKKSTTEPAKTVAEVQGNATQVDTDVTAQAQTAEKAVAEQVSAVVPAEAKPAV